MPHYCGMKQFDKKPTTKHVEDCFVLRNDTFLLNKKGTVINSKF